MMATMDMALVGAFLAVCAVAGWYLGPKILKDIRKLTKPEERNRWS